MKDDSFHLPGNGLQCGRCGQILPTVCRTIKTPGFVTRQRRCDQCGEINTTQERVIATHLPRRTMGQTD